MSGITLANPVAAMTEKIARPFDDAAPIVRQIATLYHNANGKLRTNQQTLLETFKGLGADAFTDMVAKQINWVDNITNNLNSLAGLYETCARDVRKAAQDIEWAIQPFMDIVQWVVDRLTPDIVVQQGESAVQAVLSDMRGQIHRELDDAGGFFSDVFHLNFSKAASDVEDGLKGLGHLAGDALALVAAVEPYLCQWAADVYQWVNWLNNKLNGWILDAEDWLFGLSDIADDTVVFTDPNSTTEEKWLAGIDMGLNIAMDIAMVIPGADIFALTGRGVLKLLAKFGLKEIIDEIAKRSVAKITETIVAQIVKDIIKRFEEKIAQKFSEAIVSRMLKRGLTKTIFNNLESKIRDKIFPRVQEIINDYLAGKITKEEAQARLAQLLKDADPLHSGGRAGIDGANWSERFPGLSPDQLEQRVEQIRQALLRANDISKVRQSMLDAGIDVSDEMLQAVKNYNFDSRGLSFTTENYDAWRRLATGKAAVNDIRYLVHEMAEVKALREIQQRTGFDFMGRAWESMTNSQRQQWLYDFNRNYLEAHSKALLDEYKYISQSVSNITNGSVHVSPVVAAAIDPSRSEARDFMYVDGVPLGENRNFGAWQSQGREIVTLGSAASRKLGLPPGSKISLKDLIDRIKKVPAGDVK